MGYSLIAGLPPINGLYTCFFSSIVYLFLGMSPHMSIGTYGIVALMIDSYLIDLEGRLFPSPLFKQTALVVGNHGGINVSTTHAFSPGAVTPSTRRYASGVRSLAGDGIDMKFFPGLKLVSADQPFVSNDPDEAKMMIASCFAFYVAIFQVYYRY